MSRLRRAPRTGNLRPGGTVQKLRLGRHRLPQEVCRGFGGGGVRLIDRKSALEGKRGDLRGRRNIKKKKKSPKHMSTTPAWSERTLRIDAIIRFPRETCEGHVLAALKDLVEVHFTLPPLPSRQRRNAA